MTFVLSFLTTYISSWDDDKKDADDGGDFLDKTGDNPIGILIVVILIQFLRAKADLAAQAVAAVASPATADDDVDSLKIRPSTESFINTFWVAGLVIYYIFRNDNNGELQIATILFLPLWAVGACRTVLRFAAFQKTTGSFAFGRNAQLIDGYMIQLLQGGSCFETAVPRLIVTGERKQEVEESPVGYRIKLSALQDQQSRLVTLDQVWSESGNGNNHLLPKHKDLCISFSLFKCLRRRFAGYRLTAEAGSSWAFRFFHDGLLGQDPEHHHQRIFQVIGEELSFASDFFFSPLPLASLGTTAAAFHFFFSLLILPMLSFLALALVIVAISSSETPIYWLALILAVFNVVTEIWEMVTSVLSNWTKISIIAHYIRCKNHCARRFLLCLLKCRHPRFWKDRIQQTELLTPMLFGARPWARLFKRLYLRYRPRTKIDDAVKEAIFRAFRASGGQLREGTAAVRRRYGCQAFHHGNDITWACRDGGGDLALATTTDAILVWHIATRIFSLKFSSPAGPSSSSSSTQPADKVVACNLSCYCMYLVAAAPDNSAWIKRRYKAVKNDVEKVLKRSGVVPEPDMYGYLVDSFGSEHSQCHDVLKKGSRLGKQLVEEAETSRPAGEIWELLSELWSEMVLYLAPSDNVRGHIEGLQHGGELITLLWRCCCTPPAGHPSSMPRHACLCRQEIKTYRVTLSLCKYAKTSISNQSLVLRQLSYFNLPVCCYHSDEGDQI
ncbi:uncharacterized protein LOC120680873 [Panicum virgatum]|nr:uncharacterized protein LOC120680873 [Panicum virgatum]